MYHRYQICQENATQIRQFYHLVLLGTLFQRINQLVLSHTSGFDQCTKNHAIPSKHLGEITELKMTDLHMLLGIITWVIGELLFMQTNYVLVLLFRSSLKWKLLCI